MDAPAVPLTDGRITLRAPAPTDAAAIASAVLESLDELARWMPWAVPDYDEGHARRWIESGVDPAGNPERRFLITEGERVLGSCGLSSHPDGHGEIGYWVRTSAAGRGLATAAARILLQHGFDDLGLGLIEIKTDPANVRSQRVAEKAGARRLPGVQQHTHDDGSVHELVVFVIERAD